MTPRKIIAGGFITLLIAVGLLEFLFHAVQLEYEQRVLKPVFPTDLTDMLFIFLVLLSISSVLMGALFAAGLFSCEVGPSGDRSVVRAAIPFYFVFAVAPIIYGVFLGFSTGDTSRQYLLSWLSVPSIIFLMLIGLLASSREAKL